MTALVKFNNQPLVLQALQFGVKNNTINPDRLVQIHLEIPKAVVQIAKYFGTEYLRPDLEIGLLRFLNLASLGLLQYSAMHPCAQGVEHLAYHAHLLQQHSMASWSKAGSDALKAMLRLPSHTSFAFWNLTPHENNPSGARTGTGFRLEKNLNATEEFKNQLQKLTLLPDLNAVYALQLQQRQRMDDVVQMAWKTAQKWHISKEALQENGTDAWAILRTSALCEAFGVLALPNWEQWVDLMVQLRHHNHSDIHVQLKNSLEKQVHSEILMQALTDVIADLPLILSTKKPLQLFQHNPNWLGRYFWHDDSFDASCGLDDEKNDVNDNDLIYENTVESIRLQRNERASDLWKKITNGHVDDATAITVLLGVAANAIDSGGGAVKASKSSFKSSLTTKTARKLLKKLRALPEEERTNGVQKRTHAFIREHVPAAYQTDLAELWEQFLLNQWHGLLSDFDPSYSDALAILGLHASLDDG